MIIHIFFCDRPHLFSRFLKKGFSHCYAEIFTDELTKIRINPSFHQIKVQVVKADDFLDFAEYCSVIVDDKYTKKEFKASLLNCVNVCAHLCAIKKRCYTPYRLFKLLKKGK